MAFDYEIATTNALTPHADLVPLPVVDGSSYVVVNPGMYASWDACLSANNTKRDVILSAGDYTGWGDLDYDVSFMNGTSDRVRTIRLDYPRPEYAYEGATQAQARTQHPVNLPVDQQAITAQVVVDRRDYIMISGLSCSTGQAWQVQNRYNHVTIDMCLLENTGGAFTIRFTNGDYATGQRLVVRNGQEEIVVQDRGGLNCKAIGDASNEIVTNARYLDCEVYDTTDCFSVTDASGVAGATVHVSIEGCDFYFVTRSPEHIENHVDLKIGSAAAQSIMRYCRMWGDLGHASETGSTDSFTIHRLTHNWLLEQLVLDGNPNQAFRENWGANQLWETERDLIIQDCFVNGYVDVFHVRSPATLSGVIGYNCGYMVNTDIADASIGGPTHTGNIRSGTTIGTKRAGANFADYTYDEPPNLVDTAQRPFSYWRKRWTGPELATIIPDVIARSGPRKRYRPALRQSRRFRYP